MQGEGQDKGDSERGNDEEDGRRKEEKRQRGNGTEKGDTKFNNYTDQNLTNKLVKSTATKTVE